MRSQLKGHCLFYLSRYLKISRLLIYTRVNSLNHFRALYSEHAFPVQSPSLEVLKIRCETGNLNDALLEMAALGSGVTFIGFDALLTECVEQRAIREGQRVHAHMIRICYTPPLYLWTRLIVMYSKCGCLSDACQVLDEMPAPNVVSWTAVISAYSQRGYSSEALAIFIQMLREGTSPNEFTYATILTSCLGASGFHIGRQIHSLIFKSSYETQTFVGSSLLDMYAKSGRMLESKVIFDSLTERDVVSCTAIISGYAQSGFDEDALKLFRDLQSEGMDSNYVTYTSVLTALSGLAAFNHGRQVHSHVLRFRLPFYAILQNTLIDMYYKCGNLTYSRRVFDQMPERTVISWNTMLAGYSKHGKGKEVVELFSTMREENKVKPDRITFLALLSGCSHGGMEDRGIEIFENMLGRKDRIEPDVEHYGCVVDLLGRSGQVGKAFEFIRKMPLEATPAILGSLLGSCRVHRNIHIGEIVGRRLLELEPWNAGNYVMLSNLYASFGRWEEMRTVREMMNKNAVVKEPGRSWIEINRILHTFHASDRSHPRREGLLFKVKEMSGIFKELGYVPDLSCVLYDVDDEQKEKMLLTHSEKMALALGLIDLSDGVPIRVMKNLRICVDCHNFSKFLSKIYRREVYLRDKNRFHCIVAGVCSCGDYW